MSTERTCTPRLPEGLRERKEEVGPAVRQGLARVSDELTRAARDRRWSDGWRIWSHAVEGALLALQPTDDSDERD
eukprot:10413980-Lingulodinium_polyedra.AAC.1